MADTDLLRASRDGDQFHYYWAARQALKLLLPGADLTAIAIEGVSHDDTEGRDGEDVIDIAEYYGAPGLHEANRVVYRQLKHSTTRATEEWTVSGLATTVSGFAEKFRRIRLESPGLERKVAFEFLSNRPVRDSVLRAIGILAADGEPGACAHEVKFLKQYAGFSEDADGEAEFFKRLQVDPTAPSLLRLEGLFRLDLAGFLPGAPDVHPLLLKEMIARRASSLETNHVVDRSTVLTTLGVPPERVLPAPSLIDRPERVIVTPQTRAIADDIVGSAQQPVIVHAAGGVGKSVLTTQIERNLPAGSVTLVYDCFGNGGYRRSSSPRHQHQQGLVQLANELAAHALADPLIPAGTAQPADYAKAFMVRVRGGAAAIAASAPGALLVLVVDAADNAALIARDGGERTFVADLLRETLPNNVRLVMLCRTERVDLLEPPPGVHKIELAGFGVIESRKHLESVFGAVTEAQAAEFQRRTGGNPRIQALVLSTASDLDSCLASLGEARQHDVPLFDELLQSLVDRCKDAHHHLSVEIDRLCEAMAALRPRIPIGVLTQLCGVPAALIHSFAADLGRPLLVDGDSLQFRDEPTETWFRTKYRPTGQPLIDFIDRLTPLATDEPYVAASLPQLLWEAGQVDTLVELAMTDGALPESDDLEQREIAQQRAQFALKATLRVGKEWEAARLAVKAGSLAAGHSRRLHLLRCNTDLAGAFLDASTVEDIVANRSLAADWPGSNLHVEGALLSFAAGQTDFALSRLRSAAEWLRAWVRQPDEEHPHRYRVTATDIAEVAFGYLNTDGVEACVEYLARWRPNRVSFEAGEIITTRLADSGRVEELEALGHAATRSKYLQFAVAYAAWQANLVCQAPLAQRLVRRLKRQRRPVSFRRHPALAEENKALPAVCWIIAMGLRHGLLSGAEAERILCLNLPDDLGRGAGSRYGDNSDTLTLLCGFALLSRIRRQPFDVDAIAGSDVIEARQDPHTYSRALDDHKKGVVPLGAWASLWMDCLLGASGDAEVRFRELAAAIPGKQGGHELSYFLYRGIARFGVRILAFGSSEMTRRLLLDWLRDTHRHISDGALIDAVRAAAPVDEIQHIAVELAEAVSTSLDTAQESAEYKAEQMVKLARAVQRFDVSEAHAYFTRAIDLTDRVGDDVHVLWRALLAMARHASEGNHEDDRRAYRVAQLAESLQPYLGDGLDHSKVLGVIGQLSPTTATAVASRWRDRRLCSEGPFIQALLDEEAGPLAPPAVTALAMVPFGEHRVSVLRLVERAMREAPSDGERIAGTLGEFLRAHRFGRATFEQLDETASELGIDLSGTLFSVGSRHLAFPESSGYSSPRWTRGEEDEERAARLRQLEDALGACDLSTDEGFERARQLVRGSDRLLHMEQVIDRAVALPLRELDDMLVAFHSNPHLSTFDYTHLIKKLTDLRLLPLAARRQLRHVADTVAKRFSRELTTKGYEPIDLQSLADLAGMSDADLLGTALRELGSQPATFLAEECHHLAARIAPRLTGAQAQVVLDDFGTMLAGLAPEDSADGVFANLPAKPEKTAKCLAGYLWAVLGDPEPAARWRAAHCVRILIELGCKEELEALQCFALGTLDVTPFRDARLPFYSRHALQWLLFALARSAQNAATHQEIAEFEPLLRKVIFDDAPHVVMQESAKVACLALADSGFGTLTVEELDIVRRVNVPIKVISQSWEERRERVRNETTEGSSPKLEPSNFNFLWDFSERWCRPLGEAFGISEETVLRLVGQTITSTWQVSYRGAHEDDPRHSLQLYREGSTFSYRTNWPDADDLDFYLSTHALWTVAGELLKTNPVYQDNEADTDLFGDWLNDFLLARDDGRWLADRRDPSPQSVFRGAYNSPKPDWIWQLNSGHFSERLLASDGWVTVWESSDDTSYEAAQQVLIRSALVTPEKARALAIALQTAPSYMAYRIPDADDSDYQFNAQGFQLTGWIVVPDSREGQDCRDPLAAGVRYPTYRPADEFIGLLGLEPDADMREWTRAGDAAFRSTVWDDTATTGLDRVTGTEGQRLEIRPAALQELLSLAGRSMIVQVMIDRTHKDHSQPHSVRYDQNDDESLPPRERSYKIYLFDDSGGCGEL
ncbi:hypothetical protein ACIP8Z_11475 [Streptomyces sp. NPDC088553]|uniref:hypothetical protein n=1 Tax=Streptomyces sp. NPDC088553 TaxID=3365864 RepID=UPI00380E94FC